MRKTRHSWPHTSNFTNHIEAISDAHIFLTLPEFITEFCIKLFFFFQNYEEAIPKFENWDCNLQATEVKTTVYVDDSRFRHHNARKLKRAVHQAEESEVKKKKVASCSSSSLHLLWKYGIYFFWEHILKR